MKTAFSVLAALFGLTSAQQVGHNKQEMHLPLNLKNCSNGVCQTQKKSITMDANWRWLHNNGGYQNCYEGSRWNTQFCPDGKTCAQNCALEGVDNGDWTSPYGVHSDGNELKLNFVTQGQYGKNIGSRTFMLNTESEYEMFKLLGKEFTFTANVSEMPCGLNGALYFVEMDKTGNMGNGNQAGAKYGTGYCDAQCPHDVKFIDGVANSEGWAPSPTDPNAGFGKLGSCCAELDIWEANKVATSFTAHPCSIDGQKMCSDPVTCGDNTGGHRYKGVCDKDGCDMQPFRSGNKDFFGEGPQFKVDSSKPVTVVTQFITDANGDLSEIRRKFIQNGKVIEHPHTAVDTMDKQFDSITDEMCDATKSAFQDNKDFQKKGGLKKMGQSMKNGMVLVMSIWDDHDQNMLWLDSTFPKDKTSWGGPRGTCSTESGKPDEVEKMYPNSHVMFSDIRIGDIDSTYGDLVSKPDFLQ